MPIRINNLDDVEELYRYFNKDFNSNFNNNSDEIICSNCNKNNLIKELHCGYIVCSDCGTINIEHIIDSTPEWKSFDNDSTRNTGRCGQIVNQLLPKSSIGTNVQAYGRIRIIHQWNAMPYKERSLNNIFKNFKVICQRNNIPKKIEDDAKIMYRMISEKKHKDGKNKGKYVITRGANRESIIAASIFYACRRNNITRSPKEIGKIFNLTEIDVNRGIKNFLKMIDMDFKNNDLGTSTPNDFIKRKCDEMNINHEYTKKAIQIAKNIEELNISSSHTSYSLAAASILLMTQIYGLKGITKKKISEHFEITDVTMNKVYKKIQIYRDLLVNDEKVKKLVEKMKNNNDKYLISRELYSRMKRFNIDTSLYKINPIEKNYNMIRINNFL